MIYDKEKLIQALRKQLTYLENVQSLKQFVD